MRVIGLDLSITATGIAYSDGTFGTIKTKAVRDWRLNEIRTAIGIAALGCDLVAIEDLPTHAKSAGITGMVHGTVRAELNSQECPYVLIPPASLKKYATGRGNCGKPDMAVAAFKRMNVEFGDDNQCDAWWLRVMALDGLGHPLFPLPEAQRTALAAVAWPEMTS